MVPNQYELYDIGQNLYGLRRTGLVQVFLHTRRLYFSPDAGAIAAEMFLLDVN